MTKDEVKKLLNIPKKHTLSHYIKLVSKLYGGEPEESLREYTEEVIEQNENDLDNAIACFKGLLPPGHEAQMEQKHRQAERDAKWAKGMPKKQNPTGVD